MQEVVAQTAFDGVVAAITPDSVIAAQRVDAVVVLGASDHLARVALDRGGVVRAVNAAGVEIFPWIAVEGVVRAIEDPACAVDLMAIALDIGLQRRGTCQAVEAAVLVRAE